MNDDSDCLADRSAPIAGKPAPTGFAAPQELIFSLT
jgi:hypothetical protein